jgi:uncharacterized protein (TIGR03437 family)
MISPLLGRLVIFALIASALLFLMPDQIRDPLLNKDANYSFIPAARDKQNIDQATRTRIEQSYGKLPMRFEANQGQTDARVKFTARGPGYAVFLTADEAVLRLRKRERASKKTAEQQMADQPVESAALRMKLAGSNRSSQVSGIGKLQTTSNYFIGNDPAAWRKGISNYAKVKYEAVYPGIDLVWYGNQQLLEHDFLVNPGANPSRIKVSFSGADKISIDDEGALVLRAEGEDLRLLKPHAWQESEGSRRTVDCDYRLSEKDQVEFRLGDYDTTLPLVIDPVLVYSTYIGGIGIDSGQDIAVDGEGAAYITGRTDSADFPGPSPIQPVRGTLMDAFVLKINPAGDAVIFGTWIGGNSTDIASTISVDMGGNVYIAGSTNSTNFPLQNPLQPSIGGLTDAFALKIDSSGSVLLYSTYIGGTGIDAAGALAVDGNGNVYLTGSTDSGDLPVENAFQPVKSGSGAHASDNGGESWSEIGNGLRGADANELVIAPGDPSTLYAGTDRGIFKSVDRGSTWNLLGGTQFIRNINQVIVDPTTPDTLYAVSAPQLFKSTDGGATWVPKSIILRTLAIDPTTPSKLYAGTFNGLSISTNGGDSWTPVFIPPISGGTIGQVESIVFDPITPSTIYIGATQGVYKSVNGGATWVFAGNGVGTIIRIAISRSNPARLYAIGNNSMIYKSINAGASWSPLDTPAIGIFSSLPWPLVVAPDNPDVVYVGSRSFGIFRSNDGGATWNTVNNGLNASDIRALAIDHNSPGRIYAGSESGSEAFVAKLDATGSSFVYSSYLGGGGTESGTSIVVDSAGAAYVAGTTTSANFPTVNPFQPTLAGVGDAFVAKVNETGSGLSWATFLGGGNFDNANGIAMNTTGDIYIAGVTSSSDFPLNNAIQPSLNGFQDGFIARLKNDGSALDFSTYLGGAGFEIALAIAVDSAGNPYVTGVTNSLDFPVINAVQPTMGGTFTNNDAFVTKLSPDGTSIVYSTYLGGSGFDQGNSIAVDAAANAYVTGNTSSGDFPTTQFPIRSAGPSDAFVTKIGLSADLAVTLAGDRSPVMINNQHTYTLVVTNNGADLAISTRVTNTLPDGVALISAATSQGSCSGGRTINCELGDLVAGSRVTITIIVTPSTPGTITNRASVTSGTPDARPANNTATLETNVSLLPSIYGRVSTADGNGLNGVNITVNGSGRPPVMTPDDGNYQVSELTTGGSYTVTPSRQGYVFNPPNRTINNLQSDHRADYQGIACNLSIQSASQSFPATGAVGSVTITSPDPQCSWTAQSNVPWIKLISAPAGNGSAIVSFKVEPTIGSRAGTIMVNATTISIFQEVNACPTATFNLPKYLTLPETISQSGLGGFNLAEDFNNDSVSDLVYFISQPGNGLYLALSNSSGGYDDGGFIYSGPIRFVRAADLNNDGKKDIALTTSATPRHLIILTGNGAGGFSPPVEIETGPAPIDLAIDDFNNDGSSDLAVLTNTNIFPEPFPSAFNVVIHLGDGEGGFTAPNFISLDIGLQSAPIRIQTGDFNGDGNPDLFISSVFNPLMIFYGDGAGGFSIFDIDNIPSASGRSVLGDFNGDLKTDLAIRQFEPTVGVVISIYVSTSTGELQRVQMIDANRFDPNLFDSVKFAGDFNGDGKSDLALQDGQTIGILYAQGDYTFSAPLKYHLGGLPFSPMVGDFKADGLDSRTEIFVLVQSRVAPNPPLRKLVVLSANRQGEFAAPRAFEFVPPGQRPGSSPFEGDDMKSGDVNGDGVLDLVIATATLDDAVLMLGNGRGEFGAPVSINTGVTGGRPVAIEIRDFNNDGKPDLALINAATQNLVVLLGNGQGGFTRSATLNIGTFPKGLASADFNNDGQLDLVAKAPSGGLALFLGDGQGGFTESVSGLGGADLVGITFTTGDFNGDGLVDLALSDDRASFIFNIVLLPGNGQGGFGDPVNLRTDDSARAISVSDLNLDGRDDLVYTQFPTDAVFVILSNPGGGFAAPVRYQSNFGFDAPQIKDFNGDGKQDLIIAGSSEGTFSILLGNGDGSFNQASPVMDTEAPFLITTGDFDEDGSPDLAAWRSSSTTFGVLLNRSMCVPAGSVVPVSTASNFRYRVARNSIVSLLGKNLATTTRTAIPPFLPTSLANTRVRIKDSAGIERLAPLYFVSPDRITLLIPAQTSPGVALITVTNGGEVVAQGTAPIAATAPGLFSVDLSGHGYAAALVLRIRPDGRKVYEPIVQFDFEQNRFVAVPIDLSNEAEQVFLLLTGTGIRNHSGLANVRAKIGEQNAEVTFAGSQGILQGVDQVDVRLLPALRGRGEVSVELSVDGRATNSVRIKIK